MTATHVLAVVPVSDLDVSAPWFERFFGTGPTNIPMPGILAEWRVTDDGWVQVTVDAGRAGSGLLNVAVDDLVASIADLESRGIAVSPITEANKGVRLAPVRDPDGNTITLIGGFREDY